MLRHGAPSPTLSNPLETRGLGHGVASFKGFRLPSRILLHPFAGFGWADTTGGGGATSSCTVTDAGAALGRLSGGLGADPAERDDSAEWADSAECCLLGRAGCKLLPPTCGDAGCGFGIAASSSLSNK